MVMLSVSVVAVHVGGHAVLANMASPQQAQSNQHQKWNSDVW